MFNIIHLIVVEGFIVSMFIYKIASLNSVSKLQRSEI